MDTRTLQPITEMSTTKRDRAPRRKVRAINFSELCTHVVRSCAAIVAEAKSRSEGLQAINRFAHALDLEAAEQERVRRLLICALDTWDRDRHVALEILGHALSAHTTNVRATTRLPRAKRTTKPKRSKARTLRVAA